MRSAKEITFRLRQEIANRLLSRTPPPPDLRARAPLELLPAPQAVAEAVRGTPYVDELLKIADEILQGRVPIFDTMIDYGRDIAWRRDPLRGTETALEHFRAIPYLDLAAAGDHKWVWEINRHQHLVLLAQAFVITGERKYLDEVSGNCARGGRPIRFHRGINWTSALEVGFRALRGYGSGISQATSSKRASGSSFSANSIATGVISNTTCRSTSRRTHTCWAKP